MILLIQINHGKTCLPGIVKNESFSLAGLPIIEPFFEASCDGVICENESFSVHEF